MEIRKATVEDALGIAKVQVDSWRTTYHGIVSEQYLQAMSYREREEKWMQILAQTERGSCTYIAEKERGNIVGFASGGPERSGKFPAFQGELYALYLLAEAQGKGLGRQMIRRLVKNLKKQGFSSMLVWVLADNHKARSFYEASGPDQIGTEPIEIGGDSFAEIAYGWSTLKGFE